MPRRRIELRTRGFSGLLHDLDVEIVESDLSRLKRKRSSRRRGWMMSVKPKSVKKRLKEKSFAAGVDREIVMECEKSGMDIVDISRIKF